MSANNCHVMIKYRIFLGTFLLVLSYKNTVVNFIWTHPEFSSNFNNLSNHLTIYQMVSNVVMVLSVSFWND